MKKFVIGVDIGGTKCSVTLASYDGENALFIDKIFTASKDKDSTAVIGQFITDCKAIISRNALTREDISAIGINCGGPLNSKTGTILCPPNLHGWINIPIVEIFERELNIKSYLQNDANAGAIAEFLFGAGKGHENIIFLTFGTGMGGGLILNGKLYSGTSNMAGEVGHIRLDRFGPVGFGKAGSFEGYCSGGGIAQLAKAKVLEYWQVGKSVSFCKDKAEYDELSAKKVIEAAKANDNLAKEILAIVGTYLGQALSLFIDILNPEIILLGTIYSYAKEFIAPYANEVIKKESISFSNEVCTVIGCGLGDNINDYEAVSIAIYEVWEKLKD